MSNLLRHLGNAVGADPANQPRRSQRGVRNPGRASRVPFGVLIISLAVGGIALLLALNTASAANELRRHDLADKDTSVAAQLQQVHNQVAASAAPGSLGRAARALGMVPAENPAFVVIGPNGAVHVLGKPATVQGPPLPVAPKPPKPKPTKTTPKPSNGAKSTARSTKTAQPKTSAKSTAKSTAHAHGTAKRSPSTPSTPAAPRTTPNPTVTLPGNR